jgi:hypothetical protein
MHVANRSWVVVGKLLWEPSSREMPGWGSTAKILPRGFITLTPLEPPEWVSIDPGVLNAIYSVNAAQEMIQYSVYRWIHDGIVGFVKDLGISSEYLAWEIHAIASQIPSQATWLLTPRRIIAIAGHPLSKPSTWARGTHRCYRSRRS